MLLFLLTVLNCPIINVTHCKKIHNNYCVPACIYFYWRNKQTLPSKFIMIFNQTDSSDVEVSGEEDEDSCIIFFLFLTIYFNTSFFISSFSLISSLVDFPFLLSSPSEALHPPHPELQLKIVMRKVWVLVWSYKASPGTMLDLEGHHYSHLHLMPWVEHCTTLL